MANGVFGRHINDHVLREMPEYSREARITQRDRACVALLFKNSDSKSESAKNYLDQLKRQWGDGVSTLCLVYNATGDTIKFVETNNWSGEIGPDLSYSYPKEIFNGQWGGFLHVKTPGTRSGSQAAVVYSCKNESGKQCDWMLAWDNPWDKISHENKVYTEIREAKHFEGSWDVIQNIMRQMTRDDYNSQDISHGCKSTVAIGEYPSPSNGCKLLRAVLTLAP